MEILLRFGVYLFFVAGTMSLDNLNVAKGMAIFFILIIIVLDFININNGRKLRKGKK